MNATHDGLDELMQRVLEGEATAAERQSLEERLTRDAAARARFDAQADVLRRLSTVRMTAAPDGLRDDIMAEVQRSPRAGALPADAPRAARTPAAGGRFMPARRWAFPLSALSAALVLLWATSTRQGGLAPERTGVSGTIGRPPGVGATPLLGAGQASVAARWQRTDSGFLLFLESGGLPAEVVCTAATADVRLESEPSGPGVAAGRALHLSVVPGRPAVVRGLSRTPVVVLRLQARFGGGRTETRDLTITGLQDAASGPGEGGRPTSGPPPGH